MTHPGDTPRARRLPWRHSPADVLGAWPRDTPLAALVSSDTASAARSRWSIFAPATEWRADAPPGLVEEAGTPATDGAELPFASGWLACIPYEHGYSLEPHAFGGADAPADAPPRWLRADGALVHDALRDEWWLTGTSDADAGGLAEVAERIERGFGRGAAPFRAGELASDAGEPAYTGRVGEIVRRIHAGDVYQVNLAHHLRASFEGSPRGLLARLLRSATPAFGAILEDWRSGRRSAVVSVSPELFLDADLAPGGDRRVLTRPIKGTRAAMSGESDPRRALLASDKDRAELAMIVDLMRNDLGRVCEFGSVRVDNAREIETLAGATLLHAVATVSGRLRSGVGLAELLAATFPPGSVTGAPKIAAMKLIRLLEDGPRGAYCGAIGFVSDHGPACFSVAIRTATIGGAPGDGDGIDGDLVFPVGAGVVADSDPGAEWRETLAKASAFEAALHPAHAAPAVVSARVRPIGAAP